MTDDEKARLFDICKRSKRGQYVSLDDYKWLADMFRKHTEEYSRIVSVAEERAVEEFLGLFAH